MSKFSQNKTSSPSCSLKPILALWEGGAQDANTAQESSGPWKGLSQPCRLEIEVGYLQPGLRILAQTGEVVQLRGHEAKKKKVYLLPIWVELHLSISLIPVLNPQQVNWCTFLFISAAKPPMCTMTLLVPPAPWLLLVLCWKGQCPWNFLKVKEVFLELNLALFSCFPSSLYKSTIETAFFHPRRLFANNF